MASRVIINTKDGRIVTAPWLNTDNVEEYMKMFPEDVGIYYVAQQAKNLKDAKVIKIGAKSEEYDNTQDLLDEIAKDAGLHTTMDFCSLCNQDVIAYFAQSLEEDYTGAEITRGKLKELMMTALGASNEDVGFNEDELLENIWKFAKAEIGGLKYK